MSAVPAAGPPGPAAAVVIDTNIALDLLLFRDPASERLRRALAAQQLHWLATAAMREELARVLGYERLRRRIEAADRPAPAVLAGFDALARIVPAALRARLVCRDPDDQKFIDLAVERSCLLLSKDRDLLSIAKRLAGLQVTTRAVLAAHNDTFLLPGSAP